MIVLALYESIQRAVDGVILAGLDLDGDSGQPAVIVDQVIDLASIYVKASIYTLFFKSLVAENAQFTAVIVSLFAHFNINYT